MSDSINKVQTVIEGSDNKIYLNTDYTTLDNIDGDPAKFSKTFSIPLLENAEDYYMSIVRFNISTRDIPMTIVRTTGGVTDTEWKLTLEKGGTKETYTVQWSGENDVYSTPSSWDEKNRYFWCYQIDTIINMYNDAFQNLHTQLKTIHSGIGDNPIFMEFDTSVNGPIIHFPQLYVSQSVNLFIGDIAIDQFTGFNSNIVNFPSEFEALKLNINTTNPNTIDSVDYYDQYEKVKLFVADIVSFKSLLFVSSTIQMNNEAISNSYQKETYKPIITDFNPDLNILGSWRKNLSFFQDGPYRLTELKGRGPMKRFGYNVFWRTKRGTDIPLLLYYRSYMNVKFAFFKKSTFSS